MNTRELLAALPPEVQARAITAVMDILLDAGRRLVQGIGRTPASTAAELLGQLRAIAIADTDAAIQAGIERARRDEEDGA